MSGFLNLGGQRKRVLDCPVAKQKLPADQEIGELEGHGARRSAGTQQQNACSLERRHETFGSIRLAGQNTFDKSFAVGVVTEQSSIDAAHNRVHRLNAPRTGVKLVEKT